MNLDTEIRHMSWHLEHVADILDMTDGWREMIGLIPKNIEHISIPRPTPMFTACHEDKIEKISKEKKTSPSKLLLEEWSVSGKVRPKVYHLLTILNRAHEVRAIVYLTIHLEKSLDQLDNELPEDIETESMLDGLSYPSESQLLNGSTITNNRD
ncbi:uncharacterized protein LOC126569088 isoform X1 [Anopheles aquasalis]|uniref:uncharacterized protein LOC126569088 isoform X1 n=1 Tax=Anopheles aquasalis TaxID=42839 RepID=UPI00215B04AE|nr:uncharacterized protein LOC126569088 isoform X1 [Anopheles aquasalis]